MDVEADDEVLQLRTVLPLPVLLLQQRDDARALPNDVIDIGVLEAHVELRVRVIHICNRQHRQLERTDERTDGRTNGRTYERTDVGILS